MSDMADDREPEPADGIALIRAHLAGDEETVSALLAGCEMRPLFAVVVGQLTELLAQRLPGGFAGLDELLEDWQRLYRQSL